MINIKICLLIATAFYAVKSEKSILDTIAEDTLPEDGKLDFTGLSKKYGHEAEAYNIVTEDGYILTAFRIPGNKPPVLLFHGLADTADSFILRGNKSLAITLANAGYEVWAGNNRGNKYSRRHISLNPNGLKFWDYSFHEIGYYDLAATIDFILNRTGHSSLSIIGHSQGTTVQFVLASERPEYNSKINVGIELAPSVFYVHANAFPLAIASSFGPVVDSLLPFGFQEFLRDRSLPSSFLKFFCSKGTATYFACGLGAIVSLAGFDPHSIEPEFLRVIAGHFPAGYSRKSILHYNQLLLRKKFSHFDYGERNKAIYGREEPTDYNLQAITMPVALLVGRNDNLAKVEDAELLRDVLPNVIHYEVLKPPQWNHGDFVFSKKMPKYLFPSILKILERYS